MSRAKTKSQFATALAALLDQTNLFSRAEWAGVLGVSAPAISQWVGDKTIPRADNLHMIVITLERSTDVPEGPIAAFKEMARCPATKVSPHGKRMLPTVWEYMTRPAFSELSNKLAKLPENEQEKILENEFLPSGIAAPSPNEGRAPPVPAKRKPAEQQTAPLRGDPAGFVHVGMPSLGADATTDRKQFLANYIAPTFQLLGGNSTGDQSGPGVEWEELSRSLHTLILAEPGMGKTAFLRYLSWTLPEQPTSVGERGSSPLPIYAALHQLPPIRTPEEWWGTLCTEHQMAASSGKIILLLDGFDEIPPEQRTHVGHLISGLQERHPGVGMVITSRPTPDVRVFDGMTRCRMRPPSDSRLLALVYKQLLSVRVGTERRWADGLLRFSSCLRERPDVFRAMRNPLLLSYAARLFAKRPITACHDTDLLNACLTFLFEHWDEEKDVVRLSAARVSPRLLYQWLGALCYHSLADGLTEFTCHHVDGWFRGYLERTPAERDLQALSESTGIIEPIEGDRWRFTHVTFQEYLAAKYVVESSRDATEYLKGCTHAPRMARVLKFACSITHDASPLLGLVLSSEWPTKAIQMTTLADIIALQFTAESSVVDRSCDAFVSWLDQSFHGWSLTDTNDGDSGSFPEPKWRLAARGTHGRRPADTGTGRELLHALYAVHRARMSPTKERLSDRLRTSSNNIVRSLGESLDVEGYLQGQVLLRADVDVLVANVLEF